MTNKEKFLALVSEEKSSTLERMAARKKSRTATRLSKRIALLILSRLDQLGWSQKQLAETMGISPQLVNRWVKGKENFTLETIGNISETLSIQLISVNTGLMAVDEKVKEVIYEQPYETNASVFRSTMGFSKRVTKVSTTPIVTLYA